MKKLFYIVIIGIMTITSSCGEEEANYVIPSTPVNFSIDINKADNHLNGGGNVAVYIDPREANVSDEYKQSVNAVSLARLFSRAMAGEYLGYSGLLVVNLGTSFKAYDLCCSYEQQKAVRVIPTNDSFKAKCPKCGSIFDLYADGRAISGNATTKGKKLQTYTLRPAGDNKFRITN